MTEIDTSNRFGVAFNGQTITLMNPPQQPFSADAALVFAAYLFCMAQPSATISFQAAREAVEGAYVIGYMRKALGL